MLLLILDLMSNLSKMILCIIIFNRDQLNIKKPGYNVGYDNFIYWDFIFAHSFILIITVLTHIIYGEQAKITHSVFIKGGIYIILMAILVFLGIGF